MEQSSAFSSSTSFPQSYTSSVSTSAEENDPSPRINPIANLPQVLFPLKEKIDKTKATRKNRRGELKFRLLAGCSGKPIAEKFVLRRVLLWVSKSPYLASEKNNRKVNRTLQTTS